MSQIDGIRNDDVSACGQSKIASTEWVQTHGEDELRKIWVKVDASRD